MAKYIKPTLTLTANRNSASTNPGPLSVALSLSGTDLLNVDNVQSEIITVQNSGTMVPIIDGSTIDGTETAGTDGGFIYFKNVSAASATNKIYIGIVGARHTSNDPTVPANLGASGTALDTADAESFRTMTLMVGEFAFFPWDYLGDIYAGASTSGQLLEMWRFDRNS